MRQREDEQKYHLPVDRRVVTLLLDLFHPIDEKKYITRNYTELKIRTVIQYSFIYYFQYT